MDLHDLTPVLTAEGPFVTVHVESESAVEQPQDRDDLTWRSVLQQLGERGVDAQTREAVASARGAHDEGASRLVVATPADHTLRLAVPLASPPRRPVVDVSPLPHLLPLVDDVSAQVRTVLLTTDAYSTLFSGPEPAHIATRAADLTALGVDDPQEGPMIDVLIRAAIGTAADVQLVPHELATAPAGGVGAVLRDADALGSAASHQ